MVKREEKTLGVTVLKPGSGFISSFRLEVRVSPTGAPLISLIPETK
jgi:hypothetical protein